ncbi:hypothetical protein KC19_1G061700 [Ceratodon purpureus]|uniref:Dirigent protein n=1 Tax=Ceratodon purpureus TaxID=3225 RepID=A0A8T0J369_CERPU|nr:hypothetical protein KC19_1G061700 [Ceratodon purpureus]
MSHMSARLASILSILFCICNLANPAMAKKLELPGHLKLTFYSHEIWDGPNATLLLAAGTGQGQNNMSATGMGTIYVFDNPLKTGPSNDSKVVGHSSGTAVATTMQPIMTGGLYMTADHIFDKSSKYNGSRITVIGTVLQAHKPYELLVPGGLGYFLGCSGYASVSSVPNITAPAHVCKWDFNLKCH